MLVIPLGQAELKMRQVLLHGHFCEIIIHTDQNIDMQTQTQE